MSAVSGGGNYISDGAIMEWLALQQDDIYGDLRDSMDLAETRASFNDELNSIKAQLKDANEKKDFSKVDADLQAFVNKYGAMPEFAEVCGELTEMANTIHGDAQNAADYAANFAQYQKDLVTYQQAVITAGFAGKRTDLLEPEAPAEPVKSYSKETVEKWSAVIEGKVDLSGKNDQLTMIHIQELKATLDQGSQLASTFISSGDKTSSSIIGNIA